jgi:hypothetical protein
MEKLKQHYERALLIVIGLITLVAGSMLIMKSFAIGQKFPGVDTRDGKKFEAPPVAKVADASKRIDTPREWKAPIANDSEKIYRLFASIPIVWKDGVNAPIDLFEDTPVREGISNEYLMKYNLPYSRSDVLELDHDGDKFTNQEEYEGGSTNPRDKNDHPDATQKLFVDSITATPYVVMFSNKGGAAFSVKRMPPPGVRALPRADKWPTTWAEIGQTFPASGPDANRFKALSYEERDVHIAATSRNQQDIGVLTVLDAVSGEKIELVQRAKVDIPVYHASFSYRGPGGNSDFENKGKGDAFKLEGPDLELKVLKITEKEVELEVTAPGKNPKNIKKSP